MRHAAVAAWCLSVQPTAAYHVSTERKVNEVLAMEDDLKRQVSGLRNDVGSLVDLYVASPPPSPDPVPPVPPTPPLYPAVTAHTDPLSSRGAGRFLVLTGAMILVCALLSVGPSAPMV